MIACLWRGSELQVDHVISCKVLHNLVCYPTDRFVVCCDFVDHIKKLETLSQRPLPYGTATLWMASKSSLHTE